MLSVEDGLPMQKEMDSVQMAHDVVDDAFQNFHNEEDEAFLRDCEIAKALHPITRIRTILVAAETLDFWT